MSVFGFGECRTAHGKPFKNAESVYKRLLEKAVKTDKSIADIRKRIGENEVGYNHVIWHDWEVASCVVSNSPCFRYYDKCYISDGDYINVQTFPQDYDFCDQDVQYVCGMSVPPNMMAHIAAEIYNQWLK